MIDNQNSDEEIRDAERKNLAARGSVIKGILKALGLSLAEFSTGMGMSASFLSKCLNAHPKLDIDIITSKLDEAETLLRDRKVCILVGDEEVGIFIPKRELSLADAELEMPMTDRKMVTASEDQQETA